MKKNKDLVYNYFHEVCAGPHDTCSTRVYPLDTTYIFMVTTKDVENLLKIFKSKVSSIHLNLPDSDHIVTIRGTVTKGLCPGIIMEEMARAARLAGAEPISFQFDNNIKYVDIRRE